MNNLADKITKTLKQQNIKPKPRWQFLLKGYLLWTVFSLNVLLGAMFFVTTLFFLRNNDWDIYKYLDQNFLEYVITTMPYLRLIALGGFIFLAYYNYKYTDKAYRYRNRWIILMSTVIIILIGGTLFIVGAEDKIENLFSQNLPYYNHLEERKVQIWHHPEKGLLGGEIIDVIDKNDISLRDCRNKKWQIDLQNATWRGSIRQPEVGLEIKIIGREIDKNKFEAKEIRSWNGRHRREHESERRGGHKNEHRDEQRSQLENNESE